MQQVLKEPPELKEFKVVRVLLVLRELLVLELKVLRVSLDLKEFKVVRVLLELVLKEPLVLKD